MTAVKVSAADAREAISVVRAARRSEDLFGPIERPEDISACRRAFMDLVRLVHPDVAPNSLRREAGLAHSKLSALYAAHTQSATALEQKQTQLIVNIASNDRAYVLRRAAAAFDSCEIAKLYEAENSAGDPALVALHVSAATSGDYLEREARLLTALTTARAQQAQAFFPQLLETLRFEENGETLTANALTGYEGSFSLAELRLRWFPDGLDLRSTAWIWRRLLFALGHAHNAGLIHGSVLPEAVRILPTEHGLVLTDWCHGSAGSVVPAPVMVNRNALSLQSEFYPTGLFAGEPQTPGSDIFMATKTMAYLTKPTDLGRPEVAAFIRGCTLEAGHQQPQDAFALLAEFDRLLEDLFGPRKFVPLVMPPEARPFASE
jgi:hypothetical protein